MIGVDSNVLIRIFAHDDEAQRRRAIRLIDGLPQGVLCHVNWLVIVELIWTLRKAFGFDKQQLAAVARSLTEHPKLTVPDKDIMREAAYQARENGADLPDALIVLINRAAGAHPTYTFDHAAVDDVGMVPVPN